MRLPESSSISPSVRDALAVIHRQALELIVQGAALEMVLDALCDGIDALDPDLISSVAWSSCIARWKSVTLGW